MKNLSIHALLAGVMLTAAAANAQAQTKPDPASLRMYTAMRSFVLDKAVVEELKLNEAQQTQLADLEKNANSYSADVRTLTYLLPAKESAGLDNQSQLVIAQEMLTILKEDQARRLREITLQQAANESGQGPFFTSPLILDPKLADELKLTDEQKTKLSRSGPGTRGQPLSDVLTDEQKKKWADLVGKPVKVNMGLGGLVGRPSRNIFALILAAPLQYLDDAAVQKDLELTDAQKKKLAELDKKRTDAVAKLADTSEAELDKLVTDTRAQLTKDIEEILTPAQTKRLTQLRFQFSMSMRRGGPRGPGGLTAVSMQPIYILPSRGRGGPPLAFLKLNEEQTAQIQKLQEQRVAEITKALLSDDTLADLEKKVAKLNESANSDMLAVLTDAQKTEFKELIGRPFNGPMSPPSGSRQGRPSGGPLGFAPMAVVGELYFAELLYLANKDVQAELKLTNDQVKQVSAQEAKWRLAMIKVATTLNAEKRAAALKAHSAEVEKQMSKLLTAEQSKRLKQLALRARVELNGTSGLCSYPGASAALKLTADQKAKVLAGESEKTVFSEDRQKKARVLRGEPAGFTLTSLFAGGPGGGRFSSASPFYLVQLEPVQKELHLTEAQTAKIHVLEKKLTVRVRMEEEKADGKYPTEQIQSLEIAAHKELNGLLMPEQSTRLRQLELQRMTPSFNGMPFHEKDVIEALKLSKEQQKKIAAIEDDGNKRVTLFRLEIGPRFGPVGGGGAGFSFTTPSVTTKLRERQQTELQEVLSSEQKEKWKELLGKPFVFNGGGRGGFPG